METTNKKLNLLQQPNLIFWATQLKVSVANLHEAILYTGSLDRDTIKSYISLKIK